MKMTVKQVKVFKGKMFNKKSDTKENQPKQQPKRTNAMRFFKQVKREVAKKGSNEIEERNWGESDEKVSACTKTKKETKLRGRNV